MGDPPDPRPTVLIVDDDEAVRTALRDFLEESGYLVVGMAQEGTMAIALAREVVPDIVLLDFRLPGEDGISVGEALKEVNPSTQIVMLTVHDEPELSRDAVRVGIARVVVKGSRPSLVLDALDAAWQAKKRLDEESSRGPGP